MIVRKPHAAPRAGATMVESAVVYPLTFFLLLGLVVGAAGIFRYQEVASLAREGARYAATHGRQYRLDSGLGIGTKADWDQEIYDNAIKPRLALLNPSAVTVTIVYPDVINQPTKPDNWPGSEVTVTVSYKWVPEKYLAGPITLTSTSSMPITN